MRNILVTGGTGFVGSHMIDYILKYSYGKSETMTFLIPNFKGGSMSEGFDSDSKTRKYLMNIFLL